MNKIVYLLGFAGLMLISCQQKHEPIAFDINPELFSTLGSQFSVLVENAEKVVPNTTDQRVLVSPRSLNEDGGLKMVPSKDWCSGFFPGSLWYLYEQSGKTHWKDWAQKYTGNIVDQQWNGGTHDMGFKMYCSYGNGYRLTGDAASRDILIQSAKTLITRFNPKVGCIRSWDHNADKWDYPVIIDNLMNLELLYWATKETGDSTFFNIATIHAETTLKNHFRNDNSSFHVIGYNPETGEVEQRHTHQGYAHESAWSRGQAWGLYGYTMVYRETRHKAFLDQAIAIASYLFNHANMPDDLIPYWDFNAPDIPNEPRDVSAAAIMASALLELKDYVPDNEAVYQKNAMKILENLSTDYRSEPGTNQGFLLDHSTGSKPHNSEVDVPMIYADYYYLEALMRAAQDSN
jgi:hypothetical protein